MMKLLIPQEVAAMLRDLLVAALPDVQARERLPCLNVSDLPKNATWRYEPEEIERWLEEKRSGDHHQVEVKRRMKRSTQVIRGGNGTGEALENKKKNSGAHGTEHPVNAENEHA